MQQLLGEMLAAAANQGLLTVTVVGDAGIGKTRYLEEVQYRLRRMNHPVTWYGATCLSYGREVPLQGLQGMLRALLGIEDGDSEAIMREKARRVREWYREAVRAVMEVWWAQRRPVYVLEPPGTPFASPMPDVRFDALDVRRGIYIARRIEPTPPAR